MLSYLEDQVIQCFLWVQLIPADPWDQIDQVIR